MKLDKRALMIIAAVIGFIIVLVISLPGLHSRDKVSERHSQNKYTVLPEAEIETLNESKSEVYRTKTVNKRDTEKYFENLGREDVSDTSHISLKSGVPETKRSSTPKGGPTAEEVMASMFPETSDPTPKEDVRATRTPAHPGGSSNSHARSASVSVMTPDERMEYDRKRAEMMRDVLIGSQEVREESEAPKEEQARSPQNESVRSKCVISSLDDIDDIVIENAALEEKPIRCMFLKDEKVKNGQRVTLRILEEYRFQDLIIPENSHISAFSSISDRLFLKIRTIELGGYIYPVNLEAYDNDGSAGLYCPDTAGANIRNTVVNNTLSTAGNLLGGAVGRIAGTVVSTGAAIIRNQSGETTVSVNTGYEFYLLKAKK